MNAVVGVGSGSVHHARIVKTVAADDRAARAEKTIIDTALKGLKNRVESRPGVVPGGGEDSR